MDLDLKGSYITLDAGLDSMRNKWLIDFHGLIPVIKPNRRNTRQDFLHAKLDTFEEVKHIYKQRYIIERTFAWQDTYSMINLRGFFNRL